MPGEIDLRTRIVAAAFEHLYPAFPKLGVKDVGAAF